MTSATRIRPGAIARRRPARARCAGMVRVLPDHDWRVRVRRSRLRRLLAPLGGSPWQAAVEAEAERSGTGGCGGVVVGRARVSRILPRRPCRAGLRSSDRALLDFPAPRRPRLRRGRSRPGIGPDTKRGRRRSRSSAGRQGRRRDRPGPLPCACAFAPAHRRTSLPRDALAATGKRRAYRRIRRARLARSRRCAPHPTRQGRPSRHDQSALPQRGGRHDPCPDRARRRRRDARSDDRDRGHARRRGGQREISGQAHFWRGHQSHPSLSRQDSLPLVPDPRPRLCAQAPARRRLAGQRARRRERPRRQKSYGSPRWTRSPSAAIARRSCAWTTFWPRRTPF